MTDSTKGESLDGGGREPAGEGLLQRFGPWNETTACRIVDALAADEDIDVKEIGHALVDQLSEGATLKDLSDVFYREYVRFELAFGLRDLDEGRVFSQEEMEKIFLLNDAEEEE